MRAAAIELEPLRDDESERAGRGAAPARRELSAEAPAGRCSTKTEGNPLFVEETIRMLLESDGATAVAERIPDTLQALIAARIDRLPAGGEGAAPARRRDRPRSSGTARSRTSRRTSTSTRCSTTSCSATSSLAEPRSTIIGERAFRFKHVLIREVAYGGLSKAERAELHERFAEWLQRARGRRAARDPRLPPRPRGSAARRARRRARRPSSPARPRPRSRRPAAARSRARRTARRASCSLRAVELEPTLERRYHAARAAWRMSDLPTVSVEMATVLRRGARGGRPRRSRAGR